MWAGIDPGFSGAIAIINGDDEVVAFMDMPVMGEKKQKRLDLSQIKDMLLIHGTHHITIEKAQSMPRQGVVSVANYMQGYGEIYGMAYTLGFSILEVRPVTWKKALLKDMEKGKEASIIKVRQMFPSLRMPGRIKDHGIADAILISFYGKNCSK